MLVCSHIHRESKYVNRIVKVKGRENGEIKIVQKITFCCVF